MSDKTVLKSFDIEKFSPEQDQYIEASAGTGKTYTIRKISAELVRNNIPLSEVLFVTYTEKAAGEMRDRIREEMNECVEKASPAEKRLFERACQDVDKAMIGTIHSFCRKTLHDFAYEANVPFDMENADDQAAEAVIDRLIRDEWESDICSLPRETALPKDVEYIKIMLKKALKAYSPEKEPVFPATNVQEWIDHNPTAKKHFDVLQQNSRAIFSGNKGGEKTVEFLIGSMLKSKGKLVNGTSFGSQLMSVSVDPPEKEKDVTEALKYFYPLKVSLLDSNVAKRLGFLNQRMTELYELWQQEKARQ